MKSTSILGLALLGGSLTIAAPIVQDVSVNPRQVLGPPGGGGGGGSTPMGCLFEYDPGTIIVPPGPDTPNADPIGFCRSLIQPTRNVIKTSFYTNTATVTKPTTIPATVIVTSLYTSYVTVTKSATSLVTKTATFTKPKPTTSTTSSTSSTPTTPTITTPTITIPTITTPTTPPGTPTAPTDGTICPTPVVGQTCGLAGWGYATNNIYSGQPIDRLICHQLCLRNPDCMSFQVIADAADPSPQCNLYNVASGGDNTIPGDASPYRFYDRDCPDFSPTSCKFKRDDADNKALATPIPTPFYFLGVPEDVLTEICSCIITTPVPATTITRTISKGTTVTFETAIPTTKTFTDTTVVGATVTGTVAKTTTIFSTETVTV
ncbi:hypothetical protein BJ875DRAFT_451203 [Amylocarpus encephaloides]|uniref:Apple domain-containing protein n=1 Tax=Amylocarpus encephaloides TaxID=45428 RepID=A0A9P8C938_9HELO|nr:hypothetical protein BJ875DRAFT_451203 [Amylocarpus encephaloides]